MDGQQISALAEAGASTVVTLAATDGWTAAKQVLGQLLRRDQPPAVPELDGVPAADAAAVVRALLLQRLVADESFPALLAEFIEQHKAADGGVSGHLSQSARARDSAVIVQAGRDATYGG